MGCGNELLVHPRGTCFSVYQNEVNEYEGNKKKTHTSECTNSSHKQHLHYLISYLAYLVCKWWHHKRLRFALWHPDNCYVRYWFCSRWCSPPWKRYIIRCGAICRHLKKKEKQKLTYFYAKKFDLHKHVNSDVFRTENIKAPRHWPLWGEFTGDRWIPRTKGQ